MKFLKRSIDSYWLFKEYNQVLGLRESLCFILQELLKNEKLKKINVGGEPLLVRTNSPDLKVAIRTLFRSEFDEIELKNAHFILDAGAYIGTSAIYFSKKYPNAKIIALEPEAENFNLLVQNTKSINNIIPLKAALWSRSEIKELKDRNTGQWGYTISDTFDETHLLNQKVNCISIDAILKEYKINVIDLLKMDVEGSEKEILENSSGWIDKVNVISVELHDRIIVGCGRAFYLATKDFKKFKKKGEKITAYR